MILLFRDKRTLRSILSRDRLGDGRVSRRMYSRSCFTFQSDLFEHVEEHSLCATAEAAHSVTDQKIQQTDDVVESTAVVHRGEEIQPLQGVAQTIEAGDL